MTDTKDSSALKLVDVCKTFDDRPALDFASFRVEWGEVHALLGENGAGKSTLMNIACGIYMPDSGSISIDDQIVTITGPGDAINYRIGMVHQHYKLVDSFTVSENIALACSDALGTARIEEVSNIIRKKSAEVGLEVNPDTVVANLSISGQQRVEILRMLLLGAQILILDEPTAVLTDQEAVAVLELLRNLAKQGAAVILISHKLKEVLEFTDRVTVMRAGKTVHANLNTTETDGEALTHAMVGKSLDTEMLFSDKVSSHIRLKIDSLKVRQSVDEIGLQEASMSVRDGEILGIAGVGGNGQEALFKALMGVGAVISGTISLAETDVTGKSVAELRSLGMRFIPADRYTWGIVGDLQVHENFAITDVVAGHFGGWALLNRQRMKAETENVIKEHQIHGCDVNTLTRLLSGGNAQKLLLARELDGQVCLIVAHSPTRGLDVDSRSLVHQRLIESAAAGVACILISEDLDEILTLSHTVAVISRGLIVASLPREQASRETIGSYMLGHA